MIKEEIKFLYKKKEKQSVTGNRHTQNKDSLVICTTMADL